MSIPLSAGSVGSRRHYTPLELCVKDVLDLHKVHTKPKFDPSTRRAPICNGGVKGATSRHTEFRLVGAVASKDPTRVFAWCQDYTQPCHSLHCRHRLA